MEVTIEDVKEFIDSNIGDVRDFMMLLLEYSSKPEVNDTLAVVPVLASKFKPFFEGLRQFSTELDIMAIAQFEAAGLSKEQAVSLVVRQPGAIAIIGNAIQGAQRARR